MKRLWIAFVAVMVLSFLVLGWIGTRILFRDASPPSASRCDGWPDAHWHWRDHCGAECWQSMGGMEVGSIWGHGSYVAPDWTADWLHREAVFILDRWSNADYESDFEKLDNEQQARLVARLTKLLHTNTYDPSTGTVTVDPIRVEALSPNLAHYTEVFSKGNADYAIPAGAILPTDNSYRRRSRHSFSGQRGRYVPTVPMTSALTLTIGPMNR